MQALKLAWKPCGAVASLLAAWMGCAVALAQAPFPNSGVGRAVDTGEIVLGGPYEALDRVVVASSEASHFMKMAADYVCDGADDQEQIQEALDRVAVFGGEVHLTAGWYYLSEPIVPQSGTALTGVLPSFTFGGVPPELPPDLTVTGIATGTVLTAPGGTAIESGTRVDGARIENLGIAHSVNGMVIGSANQTGMFASVLRNIVAYDISDTAIKLVNLQHVHGSFLKLFEVNRGLHLVGDTDMQVDNTQFGNSVFVDVYVLNRSPRTYETTGILLEALDRFGRGTSLNYITLIRPQVNMFRAVGSQAGYNLRLRGTKVNYSEGDDAPAFINSATIIGADLEGSAHTSLLMEYATNCQISVAGLTGADSVLQHIKLASSSFNNLDIFKYGAVINAIGTDRHNRISTPEVELYDGRPIRMQNAGVERNLVQTGASSYSLVETTPAVLVFSRAGDQVLLLPSDTAAFAQRSYTIKKSGSGSLTIQATGAATIEGLPELVLEVFEGVSLYCDGDNWLVLSRG